MTSENGMMTMPVAPMMGYGNGGMGDFMGGNGAWFLLILLALFGWGRGGNGFGNNGGGGGGTYVVANDVQRGFDQAAITTGINNIQQGLCNGFAGVNQGVSNGFAQAEIANNARQLAYMQQFFGLQQGMNTCCCEQRQATADLKYTVANENAATRAAAAAGDQKIMDKLCQLELDNIKQNYEGQLRGQAQNYENRIAALENALGQERANNQNLRFIASQDNQTAKFIANNELQTTTLEQYLAPTPRPAWIVQNPNCCGPQYPQCGCGGYAA